MYCSTGKVGRGHCPQHVSRARGNTALQNTDSTYVQQSHIITVIVFSSIARTCSIFNTTEKMQSISLEDGASGMWGVDAQSLFYSLLCVFVFCFHCFLTSHLSF
jgi:hypothetical protein